MPIVAKSPSALVPKRKRSDSTADEKSHKIAHKGSSGAQWRANHSIEVIGPAAHYNCPDPILAFKDTPFSPAIIKCLETAGYTAPTPTQSQSWPIALSKQDMISVAKTGSGKTVGFLLPSFHHIMQQKSSGRDPRILVLAPTRELATQIEVEAKKFSRVQPAVRTACVFGGAPKFNQLNALSTGVDCLVATPGRLNDFIQMRKVNLANVSILVLDEADRMLDMGFEPQIRTIVAQIPKNRQTLLFSATWPKSIQKMAREFLKHPVQVNMGDINVLQANKDIEQVIDICREDEKKDKLITLMNRIVTMTDPTNTDVTEHVKTIVFFRTKRTCERLGQEFWDAGYAVGCLHGDKEQFERTLTMNQFKQGTVKLLFATDVAARGLDVKDVGVVINFDMPGGTNGIEDYIHRIGRTGRAGAKGTAFSFFTSTDQPCAKKLIEILTAAHQPVPSQLADMATRKGGGGGGQKGGRFRGGGGRGGGFRKKW
ncbi:hypothetical protein H310_02389 [Aphanomyces invadans]|uniref:RNA helicase n=1 Tax=Aphanomyces invadans TaxID=157072 RepID=A0A024UNJ7_9STRA|nr:hypothetical protein H310_02389 [Aphanomyces invadans]ETW08011.1 hypothetical protein H310_02389 [Aphanomyces invadans]|eukprot:XP_008864104.1 hypothetical protein H310_02389 [Aphanomyces invadans]